MMDYNIAASFAVPYDFGDCQNISRDAGEYLSLKNMRLKVCKHLDELEKQCNDNQKKINRMKDKFQQIIEELETLDDNNDAKRISCLERNFAYYEKKCTEKINEQWMCYGKQKAYTEMLSELERMLDSCFIEQAKLS